MERSYSNGIISADFMAVLSNHSEDSDSMIWGIASLLASPFDSLLTDLYEEAKSSGIAETLIITTLSKGCHDAYEFLEIFRKTYRITDFGTSNGKPKVNKSASRSIAGSANKTPEKTEVRKIPEEKVTLIGERYLEIANEILFEVESNLLSNSPKLLLITGKSKVGKSTMLSYIADNINTDKYNCIDCYRLLTNDVPIVKSTTDKPTLFISDNVDIIKTENLEKNIKYSLYSNPCVILLVTNNNSNIGDLTSGSNYKIFNIPPPDKDTIVSIFSNIAYSGKTVDISVIENIVSKIYMFCPDEAMEHISKILHQISYRKILSNYTDTVIKVDNLDINNAIHEITGLSIYESLSVSYNDIYSTLTKKIIGQDRAIGEVSKTIASTIMGYRNSKKTAGAIFLYGPSGIGKTESAYTIAKEFFGGNIHREDMNTYSEKHSVSRIIGSPPGYVGYSETPPILTFTKVNNRGIILFDEIEKADNVVIDHIMNLIDTGHIRSTSGEIYNMSNFLFIFTSNITFSLEDDKSKIGFSDTNSSVPVKSDTQILLDSHRFRKEFIGRLSKVIRFDKLSEDSIKIISSEILENIEDELIQLTGKPISTSELIDEVSNSFDHNIGVRSIINYVTTVIKPRLIEGSYKNEKKKKKSTRSISR